MDSGCSSTILMVRLIEKNNPKKDSVMKWHTQAGKIATNLKVNMGFTLPELSTTEIVTCVIVMWMTPLRADMISS